ncbi:MAG: dihydrolipoamide acetyltransferase family protein, partial [Actinobacteria bacterium]|nr:dihydrolipoamide acetyltransferase family protein [Actinomycetota bacterium]
TSRSYYNMADITLPQLGETVTEGTITKWFKKVGDAIALDEPLFEVSTEKVDTEVPSPIAGTLLEIRVNEGDTVPVGTVIGVVGVAGAAPVAPVAAPIVAAPVAPVAAPVAPVVAAPVVAAPVAAAPSRLVTKGVLLSPVVRRLVADNGVDVSQIAGTGPGGRITRDDVVAVIEKGAASTPATAPSSTTAAATEPVAANTPTEPPAQARTVAAPRVVSGERDEIVALSKIRQLTGAHMLMSKNTSPHALSVVEVDYSNVDSVRLPLKDDFKSAEGFALTYLPFISRAVIDSLVEFPHLNASVAGDTLIVRHYIDLGVAVDLDYQGLIVPVVRDAETKRLRAIAREINDLAQRARTRKLSPDEIQGGTFTITNNGSAGSVLTMAIISQPQVAILSTDAVIKRPVVIETADGGESIAIHPIGNLSLTWDHRAFDGAYAARFLVKIKHILETRDWSAEI